MLRYLLPSTAVAVALSVPGIAQTVPTNYVIDTLISSGLQAPNDFCFLPDGRVLLANRGGLVQLWAGSGAPVSVGTVPSVETGSERGLLSIAADPNFASNGYLYCWWSSATDSFLHLERFTCTGDLANPTSTNLAFSSATQRTILNSVPDGAFNHNGGSTRFGPDGMLYQSIGDDAGACNAQSQTSKLGCVLRMNVAALPSTPSLVEPSYALLNPGDNPLSATADFRQLLLGYGLRNPFRMEIDQLTGNLYIGDVGQSASEEYSEYVYSAGALTLANFGWPWREGTLSFTTCGGSLPSGLTAPIAESTSSAWNSVMGGPRYRNQGGAYDFGPNYEGDAFFLDYFSGELRRLKQTAGVWATAPAVPGQPNANFWGTGFVATVSMRQGPDGALWYVQHPGTYPSTGGTLERIRPLGPTNSVVAISGGGQVEPAGEVFPQPLVARVLDTMGNPLPGGTVNFAVTGPGTLSTTNPVIADPNGFVQTTVTSTLVAGGAITVTASTPGGGTNASFSLFSRKLTATAVSNLLILGVTNTTTAVPASVPMILLMSFPGSPVLPTIVGPICTDPGYALTIVLEDGTGAFGGVSFSGTGGIGTPNKTWVYSGIPPGLFSSFLMSFQVVGFDPVTGWFRTNCETEQF